MLTAEVEGYRIDLSIRDDELWAALRRENLRATCLGCRGRMHSVLIPGFDSEGNPTELRIFAHDGGEAEKCRLYGGAQESAAHQGLKRDLAIAARRAGWTADVEISSADERCRTDVLARSPTGQTYALEAQLARLPLRDAIGRHERYVHEWGDATWFHTGRREWSINIPSLRVDDEDRALVIAGVYLDDGGEVPAPPVPVQEITPRILTGNRIAYLVEPFGYFRDLGATPQEIEQRRRRRAPVRILTGENATRECARPAAPAPERPAAAQPPTRPRIDGEHLPTRPIHPVRGSRGFCQWCHTETRWDGQRWTSEDAQACDGPPRDRET